MAVSCVLLSAAAWAQGPLAPTDGPEPVMKSLDQIEPRTPVSSLPFVIPRPGSYYLTGNLHFTAATGHAITIQASNVTLDLNGFTLSSAAAVTGDGVHVVDGYRNHHIRNGGITGTTVVTVTTTPTFSATAVEGGFRNGIIARDACQATDLTLIGCRSIGFVSTGGSLCENLNLSHHGFVGASGGTSPSIIRNSTASRNATIGIGGFDSVQGCSATYNGNHGLAGATVVNSYARFNLVGISGDSIQNCSVRESDTVGILGGTVSQCRSVSNGGAGIRAGVISDCQATDNKEDGFKLNRGATIRNSQASRNVGSGISADHGCTVVDNSCSENGAGITATIGCTVRGNTCLLNTGHGISAGSENQIKGNTCDKNGTGASVGAGIHTTGGDNRIEANACTENDRGLHMTNSGSLILRNSCASNTVVNYDIAASNRVGPIVTAPVSGAISGSTGGAGVGSENPWANFSF